MFQLSRLDNRRARIVYILLVLAATLCVQPMNLAWAETTASLDSILRKAAAQGFSGAVLVTAKGKVVLSQGYGRAGKRLRSSDRFWIASISKSFTAAAVLKCQEKRQLDVHDPIGKHFRNVPDDKKNISILQLLTHQSGLPQSYVAEAESDREAAVAAILQQPLAQPPGTKFSYSNGNYELAAAIVEIVSGKTFEEFVRAEILKPAQLENTGFFTDAGAKRVVPARNPLPERLRHRNWELGGGGMYSTTSDLLRFYRALRSKTLLPPELVKLMFDGRVPISEGQAGLAWFFSTSAGGTRRIFTRGNDSFGPNGLIYIYPDKEISIVVLSHAGDKDEDQSWSRAVLAELEKALKL